MGWTHRHARYLFRILSKKALLYTEMLTTGALLRNTQAYREKLLACHAREHPVALQLGGNNPEQLATCARMAEDAGYDEINLNMGCPSKQVRSGQFGACLMAQLEQVAAILYQVKQRVSIPVTVKCRLGIDDQDIDRDLHRFVCVLVQSGIDALIVHARKAWLHGIDPKANRTLPPLNYMRVYQLQQEFPELEMIINGGINSLKAAQQHLTQVDGVMLGRSICQNPWMLHQVDTLLFGQPPCQMTLKSCLQQYRDYVVTELENMQQHNKSNHMGSTAKIFQPALRLFTAMPGARKIRNRLCQPGQTPQKIAAMLDEVVDML